MAYFLIEDLKVGDACGISFDSHHHRPRYRFATVTKVSKTRVTVQSVKGNGEKTTDVFTMRNRRVGDSQGMNFYRGPSLVSAETVGLGLARNQLNIAIAEREVFRTHMLEKMMEAARYNRDNEFRELLAKLNSREYV